MLRHWLRTAALCDFFFHYTLLSLSARWRAWCATAPNRASNGWQTSTESGCGPPTASAPDELNKEREHRTAIRAQPSPDIAQSQAWLGEDPIETVSAQCRHHCKRWPLRLSFAGSGGSATEYVMNA
ncbi:hypothetical protein pkur_cds_471 [Pandoravirus kuranda]|uniref:Uncharacterized protein n=1 Tax=Pandoravirus kuranda TaxID=3019033 RepID=A0AA95ED80_9VIRU|nr:hypothetical protein pkur_cds_471 [Pandoravirus kuranda]